MGALAQGLGRRLQQLRKASGLTQEKLAALAGIDPKYMGSIERGEKSVSLEVLERLICALKIEPYEPFLFALKGRKSPEKAEEETLVNLIRHSEKDARPLLIHLAEGVLRWVQRRKR
ncbi:MAG: helix-turn-helix transcriptional regulator [Planctomycetes bacterium]|nr:helix-turn-helix transcriptional regulator [Planctomycetota bacterium]